MLQGHTEGQVDFADLSGTAGVAVYLDLVVTETRVSGYRSDGEGLDRTQGHQGGGECAGGWVATRGLLRPATITNSSHSSSIVPVV